MVHFEDHAGAVCFLVGAGHHTALSLRPIDAVGLENLLPFSLIYVVLTQAICWYLAICQMCR